MGSWYVEPRSNTISRLGEEKHLENRLMQTLVFLAQHQNQVVSREQFFDEVWRGRVVNEEALSRAISLLRTALDDNAQTPKFIQTIPGLGYRLIAEVASSQKPQGSAPSRRGVPENSIAVLPFVNLSDDPGNEYFSDGISEEILNVLTQNERFKVVGRTSSFAFKHRNEDLREMGKTLDVAHVLEGSVRKSGTRVRITAQLVKTDDGYHLWSETFDRELDDIFAVQDEIAEAVVTKLKLALLPNASKSEVTNPEAYALYLQSRYLGRRGTPKGYEQALVLIRRALDIAPDYAAAWNELASIYSNMTGRAVIPPAKGLRLAREAAEQALNYDPEYASAHARLGWLASNFVLDLAEAAGHFQRALALAPTDIDIIGNAATQAISLGRLDMAIALQEHAIARDPVNPISHIFQGYNLRCAGRYEEAIAIYRTALALSPGILGAQYNIGAARMLQGRLEEALTETLKEDEEGYRLMGQAPIYHDMGKIEEAEEALAKMIEKYAAEAAYNIGFIFAYFGQKDQAFEWLETAVANHDAGLCQIVTEPIIAKLYSDPRWLPFLERIGMSPDQLAAIEFEVTLPK